MASRNRKTVIVIREGTEATVARGSIRVEFNADGSVDIYGNPPVTLHGPSDKMTQQPSTAVLQPQGDALPDGWIFLGDSPSTGKAYSPEPKEDDAILSPVTESQQPGGEPARIIPFTPLPVPSLSELLGTAIKEPGIGDVMPDGTIYAGISPDTGKPFYVAAADEPLTMTWKQAMKHARKSAHRGDTKGKVGLPSSEELNVMFRNRAKIGGFNETGCAPDGWYWSSEAAFGSGAAAQSFRDGERLWEDNTLRFSVRLVKS